MKKIFIFKMMIAAVFAGFCTLGFAETVKIDYRLNVLADDGLDFVNWSLGTEQFNDSFDAESGASRLGTTKKFVRYDSEKNLIAPAGLRSLMLFAVSAPGTKAKNNLSVNANKKQVTIFLCRGGKAVLIESDKKGNIDLTTGFKKATVGKKGDGGTIVYFDDVIKEGADNTEYSSVDWSKVTYELDAPATGTPGAYKGTLKATYKNGILTVKGKIQN